MTDNADTYKFDFREEVGDLMSELGKKAETICYVDMSVTPPRDDDENGRVRIYNIMGNLELEDDAAEYTREAYSADPADSSAYFNIKDASGEKTVGHEIILRRNESFSAMFGEKYRPMLRLFTLYHETGHALTSPEKFGLDGAMKESMADAYATVKMLQRFGQAAVPLLSMISWQRALISATLSTDYLTSPVIDKIVADSATRDFSALTPDGTLHSARHYARAWTPDEDTLGGVEDDLLNGAHDTPLDNLAEAALDDSSDPMSFYMSAKILQPTMEPQGMVLDGEHTRIDGDKRQKLAAAIDTRAQKTGLSQVFRNAGKKAATDTLAGLLETTAISTQRRFTVKIT